MLSQKCYGIKSALKTPQQTILTWYKPVSWVFPLKLELVLPGTRCTFEHAKAVSLFHLTAAHQHRGDKAVQRFLQILPGTEARGSTNQDCD